jgi:hypothetical protein
MYCSCYSNTGMLQKRRLGLGMMSVRGRGAFKVGDPGVITDTTRALSLEEGSGRWTTHHRMSHREGCASRFEELPLLTKTNYNQWSLLMKFKLEARCS